MLTFNLVLENNEVLCCCSNVRNNECKNWANLCFELSLVLKIVMGDIFVFYLVP